MSAATRERHRAHEQAYARWTGATRPYDLVKEAVVAIGVMALLATVLTIVFSSPDERPSTIAQWARTQPFDFVTTASAELGGTSDTAGYGPPYNHAATGQVIGPSPWALMALLSLAFICIPFIPGVRDIPRRIPLYRLIWREHYRGSA